MGVLISGFFCPHQAVGGIDGLVGLPTLCVHKFSVDEELMRHFYAHVVDALLHLSEWQKCKTQKNGHQQPLPLGGFALQQKLCLHNPPPVLLLHPLLWASSRTSGWNPGRWCSCRRPRSAAGSYWPEASPPRRVWGNTRHPPTPLQLHSSDTNVTFKKNSVCICSFTRLFPCDYLTTSMDAAPALKKSVESSIWLTLLRMLFHTACRDTINRQHPRVWNHPKMDNQGRIYPHLLSKALLLLGELHSSVAPGAEVLRRRNHLPVFKLQILHQQLERWWNYGNEKI